MDGDGCDGAAYAGACLTVDLAALRANYALIAQRVAPARAAGVVKADAYGLGAVPVVRALLDAGCRDFFVAHLCEALPLTCWLPAEASLYVLNGLQPGAEAACAEAGIVPVLNAWDQAMAWRDLAVAQGRRLPAVLQIDSGMSRLGLPGEDVARLAQEAAFFDQVEVRLVMSHLACGDIPQAAANDVQAARFEALAALLPPAPRSLANSGAVFGETGLCGDLVRPGLALYGAAPLAGAANPMRPVVGLVARVIQVRTIATGVGVGYGLTFTAPKTMRVATVCVGYADGWPRRLGNCGAAYRGDVRLPIIGRVSMDSMTLDVTALRERALRRGDTVELVGPHQTLDEVATAADTVAYEILTGLGRRFARVHIGETDPDILERTA